MRSGTFWACCLQGVEALQDGRPEAAEIHFAAARNAVACGDRKAEEARRAVLQRYQALLANHASVPAASRPATLVSPPVQSSDAPSISLVSSVFNRDWQLRQTLPDNLATIRGENDVDLVLVDFGGADSAAIRAFLEEEFALDLISGKLKYHVARVPWTRFHMATAKNVAHRLSTGRFVFSLDADNRFLPADLADIREHLRTHPHQVLHQTTGSAPMRHEMWQKYELFSDAGAYHRQDLTWDGSCGRIGVPREAFERVNGYNENFVGMGMDDIDFLIRCIRAGSGYRHVRLTRPAGEVYIDNGSASASHQHENNQENWQRMDAALGAGQLIPIYTTDSPPERFVRHVPTMVRRSGEARVTLFSSLFRVEPYIDRFLHDLSQITQTQGVCVWLLDVIGSHPRAVSERLRAAADGSGVFYIPVHLDPGLYALWNIAIGAIRSPFLGNLNADDLRGAGWLRACLEALESGLADIASPVTVPFEDAHVTDHGRAFAALRSHGQREPRWFDSRVVVSGQFPNEKARHEPLVDGEYSAADLFQILPDGTLASYCIPNASALWRRRVHELAGGFDEPRWGALADLALWAEAGAQGLRFRQVPYPALFFISAQQAHRRQTRSEDRLVQLALRHGAPPIRDYVTRRLFDLSRIGGSYGDHHFLGWNWVRDKVAEHFRHTEQRIVLDMFVERNFFWNPNPGEADFVFRQPWVSFVHTTPHDNAAFDHKGQNLDALLSEPRFLQSLDHCRGLIVLSEDNQRYLRERLSATRSELPIYRLFHPNIPLAEPTERCSVDLGSESQPKVFHVGWHLRSFSAFARLRLDRTRKVLLVPKNQPIEHFLRNVVDRELRLAGLGRAEDYFGDVYTASQADYAHILRRAVIFNHYIRPAGSNLISECISAGARLVVNRHPAFEEYLGTDYPLFYDGPDDADATVEHACTPASRSQLREHLEALMSHRSIDLFCRDLARIGQDVYARA
jgi:hypothetical protein